MPSSFKQYLAQQNDSAPDSYFYHATYTPFIPSIRTHGLGSLNHQNKNWDDSKPGVTYLASSKSEAESYAETNENVPDDYLDKIHVFKIHKSKLNPKFLKHDENVIDGLSTVEYHVVIPFHHLENC